MAGYSVSDILAPQVIAKTISRLALPGTSLSQLFGWNVSRGPTSGILPAGNVGEGGSVVPAGNFDDWDLRTGQYDIFDITRKIATGSTPGTPPTRTEPQRAGFVQFTIPRAYERITLSDEKIHNQRPIGGPSSGIDRGGKRYIMAQERYLAARFANLIEFQSAALLRGKYFFSQDGDRLLHSFTSGDITIDYQRPAGNLSKLNMLGGGDILDASWDSSDTDIPAQLFEINAAMVQLTGLGLKHVVCTSTVWNYVVNNTKVHTQGGSSQIVFDTLTETSAGEFTARLRSIPWVTWHIVDYVLDIETAGGTFTTTKLIEDDHAAFLPEIDDSWVTYMRGGEWVTEGPNGTREFRRGFYPYAYPEYEPSGWNLLSVLNGFPANPVPKAIAYGLVKY